MNSEAPTDNWSGSSPKHLRTPAGSNKRRIEYIGAYNFCTVSKLFFSTLLSFVSTIALSQDYIVTLKSDTIRGEVKILSYDLLDRVQVNINKKKSSYTALQIRRAWIRGEEFTPVKLDRSIRMMKVIRTGFLSLYAFRAPGQGTYDTRIIQKLGRDAMEVPNLGFKKYVGDLVADCPLVAEKVGSGDFDRNNMEQMIDDYNACILASNTRRIQEADRQSSPVGELIDQMKTKVSASELSNKNEVNDLLNSILDRYKKKEAVPAYMKDGLKGYLDSNEILKADMEKLFTLIDK